MQLKTFSDFFICSAASQWCSCFMPVREHNSPRKRVIQMDVVARRRGAPELVAHHDDSADRRLCVDRHGRRQPHHVRRDRDDSRSERRGAHDWGQRRESSSKWFHWLIKLQKRSIGMKVFRRLQLFQCSLHDCPEWSIWSLVLHVFKAQTTLGFCWQSDTNPLLNMALEPVENSVQVFSRANTVVIAGEAAWDRHWPRYHGKNEGSNWNQNFQTLRWPAARRRKAPGDFEKTKVDWFKLAEFRCYTVCPGGAECLQSVHQVRPLSFQHAIITVHAGLVSLEQGFKLEKSAQEIAFSSWWTVLLLKLSARDIFS